MGTMYTFTEMKDNDVTTTVTFNVPSDATGYTFHSMCVSAMRAFGWAEKTVEECMGEPNDDAFMEFDKE